MEQRAMEHAKIDSVVLFGEFARFFYMSPVDVLALPWRMFFALLEHKNNMIRQEENRMKQWQSKRKN
jgi:hypothetical protein